MAEGEEQPADEEQEEGGERGPKQSHASVLDAGGYRVGGLECGREDAEYEAGQRERVGKAHRLCVHDGEAEEQEAKHGGGDTGDGESEAQPAEQEERGRGQFDRRIAPGDALFAMAATSEKKEPAEQGDVIAGRDRGLAARAVRGRTHDGFVTRQAGDADIEEAAEGEAEEDDEDGDDGDQVGFSGSTLMYGWLTGASSGGIFG